MEANFGVISVFIKCNAFRFILLLHCFLCYGFYFPVFSFVGWKKHVFLQKHSRCCLMANAIAGGGGLSGELQWHYQSVRKQARVRKGRDRLSPSSAVTLRWRTGYFHFHNCFVLVQLCLHLLDSWFSLFFSSPKFGYSFLFWMTKSLILFIS